MNALIDSFRTFKPKRNADGLDLVYIPHPHLGARRLVAMCEPSDGSLKGVLLRNNLEQVAAYFGREHAGHTMILNLREVAHKSGVRATFDAAAGQGDGATRFVHVAVADHEVPKLEQLLDACEKMDEHLRADEANVVAVHCKAGKGRTGTFIVAYLLYSGAFETAEEALEHYAVHRSEPVTKTKVVRDEAGNEREMEYSHHRGVDQASQVRWTKLFERLLHLGGGGVEARAGLRDQLMRLKSVRRRILQVRMLTLPDFDFGGGCHPYVVFKTWGLVREGGGEVVAKLTEFSAEKMPDENGELQDEYVFDCDLEVQGEVKIELWDRDVGKKDERMCRLWVHPGFVDTSEDGEVGRLVLHKRDIDDAWKSEQFSDSFRVQVLFAAQSKESAHASE